MKKYVLIAGVNGAGKSTLYYLLSDLKNMPRVNTDDIVKEFGHWNNFSDVLKAGKIAVSKINYFFDTEISFIQETTLCGKSILRNIKKAKEKGYIIEMHYVGLESARVAKERVSFRVSKGGHGIPDADIERRYTESFRNLKIIFSYCDTITFYDNTKEFNRFALYENGKPERISQNTPLWFKKLNI